jgi:glycosyltransferase involved in cell wall biosynthesis
VRILVTTVVHNPQDSRIRYRQISALLDAGWKVTYAAPFTGYDLQAGEDQLLTEVDVPRASGRHRLRALRAARRLLKQHAIHHDVILLHDPELLLALPGLTLPPVVWDVHEDTAAALTLKPWLPRPLRPVVRTFVGAIERWAERNFHLILAEDAYVQRFRTQHLVVPNLNRVPATIAPPDEPRLVYVGSLTRARGALEMIEVARLVAEKSQGALKLLLIGTAEAGVRDALRAAAAKGFLERRGFLPSDQAMALLDGSLAGLSLLRDEPNYRVSLPTKVVEYMAHGVPVITTPLPLAAELVNDSASGVVVPFDDAPAAAEAVLSLWADLERRHAMGKAGHQAALERFDWRQHAGEFVAELERVAQHDRRPD